MIRNFIFTVEKKSVTDTGGYTNRYGLSFRFLKSLPANVADIDGDGDVDADDIKAAGPEKTWELYEQFIFGPSGIDLIQNIKLLWAVQDTAVNMGGGTAAKLLQRSLNRNGAKLKIDGSIGPATIDALHGVGSWILSDYLLVRCFKYDEIAEKSVKHRKYHRGWCNRVRLLDSFLRGI